MNPKVPIHNAPAPDSATSDSYLTTATSTVHFRAVHLSDSNYTGSQSPDDAEQLTVNPSTVTITVTSSIIARATCLQRTRYFVLRMREESTQ